MTNSGGGTDSGDIPESVIVQAATIRASGFFDDVYYRAQRVDLPADMDPAIDYLLHGGGVAPGPLFDAAGYLENYQDVAEADVNPLLHYLHHGRAEGRRNVFESASRKAPQLIVPVPPTRRKVDGLAVVVEASRPDAMDQLCGELKNLPGHFTLLVAAPVEAAIPIIETAVARAQLDARLICRIMPDGGGERVSVFSLFTEEVLRHEQVLYLHTRCSRAAGENIPASVCCLAGSEPFVDTVIQAFETYPNIGLIFSAASSPLSPARETGEAVRKLLSAIGIAREPGREIIDYPVDGEFWARVDALRPILELGLSDEDISEDRKDARHAASVAYMRAIPVVVQARQYGYAMYNPKTGEFSLHRIAREPGQGASDDLDRFSRLAFETELVSFDVFDTLLIRDSVSPEAVQRYAGQLLNDLYPETLAEFFQRRKDAEHSARAARSFQGDVDLTEIYERFERTPVWTEDVIARARSLEEDIDTLTLRKNPGIEDLLRFAKAEGKRLIALSDTYYSADKVKSLLHRENLADFFDEIYVSSDRGARKDRGDLWDKAQEREKVQSRRWLHVGDNEHSDIRAAAERQLRSLQVWRPATVVTNAGLALTVSERYWATDLAMGPAVNRLAANVAKTLPQLLTLKDAKDVGFTVFGPIVFGFLQWIISNPALQSVSNLYFLSREGFLLHRIYEHLRNQNLSLRLPPGSYLYASRRATLSASQGVQFAPHNLLAETRFEGTMAQLLRQRIGFELTRETDVANSAVRLPDDEKRVLNDLQTMRSPIGVHTGRELHGYRRYLEQAGLTTSPAPAVVDIGYSATIQAALQIITGKPMTGFYLGTTPRARQVEEGGGRALGYLAQDMAPGSSTEPALAFSLLMEAFLIAPHGQLMNFRLDGDQPVPVFRKPSHDEHSAAVLAELHDGAALYCAKLTDIYGESIWRSFIDKRVLQEPFRALIEGMIDIPKKLRSVLHVEDDFCGAELWKPLETPKI